MIFHHVFAAVVATLSLTGGPVLHPHGAAVMSAAVTGSETTLANSRIGCRSADIWTEAAKLESSDKYLLDRLKTGDCTLLPAGTVRVEETSPAGQVPELSCIKAAGLDSCWWIPKDSLE